MSRSRRSRQPGILGPVLVALLPLVLLIAAFNFIPDHYLDRAWPLGIQQSEVNAYKETFSFFDKEENKELQADWTLGSIATPGRPMLADSARSSRWSVAKLSTGDAQFEVKVRRLRTVEDGYVLRTKKNTYIEGRRQIVLIPATVESIKERYLQILAEELNVPSPEVSFVSLSLNGGKPKAYLVEERVDDHFAERTIGSDALVFEKCADSRWPACIAPEIDDPDAQIVVQQQLDKLILGAADISDVVGEQEMSGLLILLQAASPQNTLADHSTFAFRWMDGKIIPIRKSRRSMTSSERLDAHSILYMAAQSGSVSKNKKLAAIQQEIWRIKERFSKAREQYVPLLARLTGVPTGIALARAENIDEAMLERFMAVSDTAYNETVTTSSAHSLASLRDLSIHSERSMPTIGRLAIKYKGWLEKDTLVLPRGRYIINEDLIIPKGKGLKLLSGVRMFIAPGKSILVQGPFSVRASSMRPCFIRPLDPDSSWGSIAVNMEEGQTSIVNGLYMSGGSEVIIGGHKHTGMLSFHNGNVVLSHSGLSDSRGADLVNIKNGKVRIEKCTFNKAFADLVDLDNVTGSVSQCKFSQPAKDLNGDGLDLSASELFVERCTFSNCRDKGLSVGEKSRVLVQRSIFYQDSIGVAVKDLSEAHLYGCTFRENQIAFNAYQKKAWMGGAKLWYSGCVFYNDNPALLKDELSELIPVDVPDREVIFRFEPYGAR